MMSVLMPALDDRGERPEHLHRDQRRRDQRRLPRLEPHLPADEAGRGRPRALARGHQGPRGAADPAAAGAAHVRSATRARSSRFPACACRACSTRRPLERNLKRWIDWDAVHRERRRGPWSRCSPPSRPARAPGARSCSSRATASESGTARTRSTTSRRASTTSTCAPPRRSRSSSRRCASSTRARRAAGTSTAARA